MKTYLVILLLIICQVIIAQKEERIRPGKTVHSGFVFIDGKYIEPPYKFKQKGPCRIYLNGHYIHNCLTLTDTVANPYKVDKLPEIPETIDSMTSFNELYHMKYDKRFKFIEAVGYYFHTHYPRKEALIKIKEYYKQIPCVKNVEGLGGLKVEFYNGDIELITTDIFWDYKFYENYGIHANRQVPSHIELYKKGDKKIISMIEILIKNGGLVFDSNNKNTYDFFPEYTRHKTFTDYFKIDTLSMPREVLDTIKINMKYLERLKKENMLQNNNNLNQNTNEIKSSVAYSPATNILKAIFPSTWDINAFGNYQMEINNLNNYIAGYGYEYAQQIDFIYDATANDDVCGNLTYNAVKNIANLAGILLVGTHGRPPNDPDPTHEIDNGFFIWYATSKDAIELWCNNDPLVHATPIINKPNNWQQNTDLWGAFVQSDWVNAYWKNSLEQNKAITILSSCYSYTNGMVEECRGGIAFGYNSLSYEYNSIENEKQLFKRMNGTIDGGQYREASDAYIHMPVHLDAFMYRANCLITLCPAPKSRYPEAGATVGLQGDGWFEVDTYCDATVPINDVDFNHSPIAFEWTNPGLSITNVQWDDPDGDGLSNKIVFHWESTSNNMVTVKINHHYWQSAPSMNGQYHLLDYNKVTPNNEDGQYIFTISSSVPTQAPIADFNYTISGNTVYFQDQSANTPTSWQWNFGDGQTSTQQNVSHTYANAGTYSVTLTASNLYGSSNKTKQVNIGNISQSVTVSGRVEDENFIPIAGATVSCSYGSTTTNANGYYSLQVPYNASDCGAITASAPGYQPSLACNCNNLISNKICNFTLFKYQTPYIKCLTNEIYRNTCHWIFFKVVNNSLSSQIKWYVDNEYIATECAVTTFSYIFSTAGNHVVKAILNNNIELTYEIFINQCNFSINIYCPCEVASVGANVYFYEILNSDIANEWKIGRARNWILGLGSIDEKEFPKKNFNELDPYNVMYSFSVAGQKLIVLKYWEKNIWGNYNNFVTEVWGRIDIINCNYDSYYLPPNYDFFTMSVYNDDYTPARLYGGRNVNINGQANYYLNKTDINVFACNEIIITGDEEEFIANGIHELILENYNSPCVNNLSTFKNSDTLLLTNDSKFNIYPNPFNTQLNLYLKINKDCLMIIRILDVLGNECLVKKEFLKQGEHLFMILTENLNTGTYFINISNNEDINITKIIIKI